MSSRGQSHAENSAMLLALTLAGVGISRILDLVAQPYLLAGQLVPVWQTHFATRMGYPIFAAMLQDSTAFRRSGLVVDFWAEVVGRYEPYSITSITPVAKITT